MTKRSEERDEDFDNATAFVVTKPIDLAVLTEDVRKEHGWKSTKRFGLIAEGDLTQASDANPITVWVTIDSGEKPDTNAFKRSVTSHDSSITDELAEIRQKAIAGKTFNEDEIQLILRRVVLAGKGM